MGDPAKTKVSPPPLSKVIEGQIQFFQRKVEIGENDFKATKEKCEGAVKTLGEALKAKKPEEANVKQIEEFLETLDDWNMDTFKLHTVTNGHPLYYIGWEVFRKWNILEKFGIKEETAHCFLCGVEATYRDNTFHNRTHATDVIHSMNYLLNHGLGKGLSDLDIFAAIIAAMVHDVDHPGTSNAFQVAIQSDVALRYNDKSVLENHHLACAFNLFKVPECNILAGLSQASYVEFREILIAMILATDLANHFDLMNKWKSKMTPPEGATTPMMDVSKKEDKMLMLQMGIKLADVNNQAKIFPIAEQWSNLVVSEFFEQGDIEREKAMKISPNCDRTTVNMPKSQVGFIDFIVRPLFENVAAFFTELQPCVDNISTNREIWNSRVSTAVSGVSSAKPGTPASRAGTRPRTPRPKTPATSGAVK